MKATYIECIPNNKCYGWSFFKIKWTGMTLISVYSKTMEYLIVCLAVSYVYGLLAETLSVLFIQILGGAFSLRNLPLVLNVF